MPKITIVALRATSLNAVNEKGERVFATIGNIAKSPVKGGGELINIVDNDLTKSLSIGDELFAAMVVANAIPGKDQIAKLICKLPVEIREEKQLPNFMISEASDDEIEAELIELCTKQQSHKKFNARVNAEPEFSKKKDKRPTPKNRGGAKNWTSYYDLEEEF